MIRSVRNTALKLRGDRNAVTAIEYSLIAALIAVAIIGVLGFVGTGVAGTLTTVANAI